MKKENIKELTDKELLDRLDAAERLTLRRKSSTLSLRSIILQRLHSTGN